MSRDEDVIAAMYEIGRRHPTQRCGGDWPVRDVHASDLAEAEDGPVPEEVARIAYRARRDRRSQRGGRRGHS